uniref:Uncharacterized protein n=1 Tax=Lotharella globosa TaxID=91324 RepID=A0A7S3YG51_9EUKA
MNKKCSTSSSILHSVSLLLLLVFYCLLSSSLSFLWWKIMDLWMMMVYGIGQIQRRRHHCPFLSPWSDHIEHSARVWHGTRIRKCRRRCCNPYLPRIIRARITAGNGKVSNNLSIATTHKMPSMLAVMLAVVR